MSLSPCKALIGALLALFTGFGTAVWAGNCPLPTDAPGLMMQVLAEINAVRAAKGKAPLVRSAQLDQAAQGHACWMSQTGTFSHEGAGGSMPRRRIYATGYHTMLSAENIAWGQKSAREVMQAWMESDGHRRNILLSGVDEIGLGVALMNGRVAWVTDFAAH